MNLSMKESILKNLWNELDSELKHSLHAASETKKNATSSEMAQEGKYDTRRIEMSYLAGAQEKRANEIKRDKQLIENFSVREFRQDMEVEVGAGIKLISKSNELIYFISPSLGGKTIECENILVQVLSRKSPLAIELIGLSCGDTFEVEFPKEIKEYTVLDIY